MIRITLASLYLQANLIQTVNSLEDFIISKIEELAFQRVSKEDALWSSRILDSITIVELAVEIENEFNVDIPFDEIVTDNFETVALIMEYVKAKQS